MNKIFGGGGEGGGSLLRAHLKMFFLRFWSWRVRKNFVNMFKIRRRPHCWIVTRCRLELLQSIFYLYRLRGWFQVGDLRRSKLPQLFFGVEFHIVTGFQKSLLYHFPLCKDRDIRFTVFYDTIVIKPKSLPVSVNLIHSYRATKFHLFCNNTSTWETVCFHNCASTISAIGTYIISLFSFVKI